MRKKEGEVLWLRIIVQGLVREQGENFLLSKGKKVWSAMYREREKERAHC